MSWILSFLTADIADNIVFLTIAQEVLEDLWGRFPHNTLCIFQIKRDIACQFKTR